MKYSILLLLLILMKCDPNTIAIEEYTPEKIAIDSSVQPKRMEIVDTIELEETAELIIQELSSAAISQDGEDLAIAVPPARKLAFYNYEEGKIKKIRFASSKLSDSIALKDIQPPDFRFTPMYAPHNWKYIKVDKFSKYKLKQKDTTNINAQFVKMLYHNNELYSLVFIYLPTVSDSKQNHTMMQNYCFVAEFNNGSIKKIIPTEINDYSYFMPSDFVLKSSIIYATTSNFAQTKIFGKYDSLLSVAEYDLTNGNKIDNNSCLPESYCKNKIGYSLWWEPQLTKLNDKIYVTYPVDDYVYGLNNKKLFKLKNLPFSNDSGLKLFKTYKKYVKNNRKVNKKEILNKLYPIKIVDVFNADGNLAVIYNVSYSSAPSGYHFILQEYTPKGKLLSHSAFRDTPENPIKHFAWDSFNKYLVLFRKGKQHWTMERLKW